MSEADSNFIVIDARVVPFHGRMVFESGRGYGALLNADTLCEKCGQSFKLGDMVETHLRRNNGPVSWHHKSCTGC